MTRPLRIQYPGAVYHIIARGNERKNIFLCKRDYDSFLTYLRLVCERFDIKVFAYCLMSNHYHLLIQTKHANLSLAMRDLNGYYSLKFNKRHGRVGHVFQGRYKSILVQKEVYLLGLSRYIHLNPVKAGICAKAEDYPYSSMPLYLGKNMFKHMMDLDFVLSRFGKVRLTQVQRYLKYLSEPDALNRTYKDEVYGGTILGSETFIEEAKKYCEKEKLSLKEVSWSKKIRQAIKLDDILEQVIKHYGVDKNLLFKARVRDNKAKGALIYLARKYTDYNLNEISSFLKKSISYKAISLTNKKIEDSLKQDRQLDKDIKIISERLGLNFKLET